MNMSVNDNEKMLAIKEYFGDVEIVEKNDSDYSEFEIDGIEYMVLNIFQREEMMKDYVRQSLWAFNPSFMSSITNISEKVFSTLSELCEEANEAIESIVDHTCGMEHLIQEAVDADGYGHFISSYDGDELELSDKYFAYRQ